MGKVAQFKPKREPQLDHAVKRQFFDSIKAAVNVVMHESYKSGFVEWDDVMELLKDGAMELIVHFGSEGPYGPDNSVEEYNRRIAETFRGLADEVEEKGVWRLDRAYRHVERDYGDEFPF